MTEDKTDEVTITQKRYRQYQEAEAERDRLRLQLDLARREAVKLHARYYADENVGCEIPCELVDGVCDALKDR